MGLRRTENLRSNEHYGSHGVHMLFQRFEHAVTSFLVLSDTAWELCRMATMGSRPLHALAALNPLLLLAISEDQLSSLEIRLFAYLSRYIADQTYPSGGPK
jgi:hypothetical protein